MKFKLKVTRIEREEPKLKEGLYATLLRGKKRNPYNANNFDIHTLRTVFSEMFHKEQDTSQSRRITVITNEAGIEAFNRAVQAELNKNTFNAKAKNKSFKKRSKS